MQLIEELYAEIYLVIASCFEGIPLSIEFVLLFDWVSRLLLSRISRKIG